MLWWVANEAARKSHTQPFPNYKDRESCRKATYKMFSSPLLNNAQDRGKKHFPLEKRPFHTHFFLLKHYELLLLICNWLNKALKPTDFHIC